MVKFLRGGERDMKVFRLLCRWNFPGMNSSLVASSGASCR
jgi:hypothetical protein